MKLRKLISELQRIVAPEGYDLDVVIDDEVGFVLDIGYRSGTGCVHIDMYFPEDGDDADAE